MAIITTTTTTITTQLCSGTLPVCDTFRQQTAVAGSVSAMTDSPIAALTNDDAHTMRACVRARAVITELANK